MNIWVAKAEVYCDYNEECKYKFAFYSEEGEFDIDITNSPQTKIFLIYYQKPNVYQ